MAFCHYSSTFAPGRITAEPSLNPQGHHWHLTLKSRGRLGEIDLAMGRAYARVWCFAKPKLIPTLRKIAAEGTRPQRPNVGLREKTPAD